MCNLLRDIDQAHTQRKFIEKPLLVGQHTKLSNEHMGWAFAVEQQCGTLMGQFVVDNPADRAQFWKLKNRYRTWRNGQAECHLSRKQAKHHINQVDQDLLTVERVLQVSNDWCYNIIVDKCRIETVTLFQDEAEAERKIFLGQVRCQRTMLRDVSCARLPNGSVAACPSKSLDLGYYPKTYRDNRFIREFNRNNNLDFKDLFGRISELGNIPKGACLGASLSNACKCKRCDKGLLLADMAGNGQAFQFASEVLKGDREVVLAAVEQGGWALQYASDELKGDSTVVLAAVAQNWWALKFASEVLKGDRDMILAAVAQDPGTFQFASEVLKGDKDLVLAVVAKNWRALKFVCKVLTGDREVVLAAVAQDGRALQFASEELLGDRQVVLAAVAQKGWALFASKELQGDREVVLAAMAQDGIALLHASEVLQDDRQVVLAAVKQHWLALKYAPEKLKGDREVVLAAVKQNWLALEYASEKPKGDWEVVLAAVVQNGLAFQMFASKELKEDWGAAGKHYIRLAIWKANTGRLHKAEAELIEARAKIDAMETQLAVEVLDVESGEIARTKGLKRGRDEGGGGGSGGSGGGGSGGGSSGGSSNLAMQTMVVQGAQLKKIKQEKMQVENNYDNRMLCIACQDSEREVMFLPCSHVGMCAGCAASVSECPTCRGRIDSKRKIQLV
jgi:uncharacterized membrane protein YgcG